jgi:hypothetical protein
MIIEPIPASSGLPGELSGDSEYHALTTTNMIIEPIPASSGLSGEFEL